MKIAHVIHGLPPYNNAGAEIYTYKIAREQARSNKVAIFHRFGDTDAPEYELRREERDGIDIRSINNNLRECKSFQEGYTNPPVAEAFRGFLDEFAPDVVHIGHLTMLSTLIVGEIKKRGIPRLMTLHDFWMVCRRGQMLDGNLRICRGPDKGLCEECHPEQIAITAKSKAMRMLVKISNALHLPGSTQSVLLRKLRRFIAKRRGDDRIIEIEKEVAWRRSHLDSVRDDIDLFISPSAFLREQFINFGVAPERIIHSDNGQDTSPFRDLLRKPSDKIRFGFVGAIIPSKGVHILLEAFRGINPEQAELNVFGEAAKYHGYEGYPDRIKSLAQSPGIRLRGRYQPEQVADVFSEIDVLVVPSLWYENQPLVIMEAFMAGAPVIASDSGGMAEIVRPGKSGLLFKQGSPKSLRTRMQRLLDEPALLGQVRGGIPKVKTIEDNAEELAEIYEGLIGT